MIVWGQYQCTNGHVDKRVLHLADAYQEDIPYNPRHVPTTETVNALAMPPEHVPFNMKRLVLRDVINRYQV